MNAANESFSDSNAIDVNQTQQFIDVPPIQLFHEVGQEDGKGSF